MMAMQEPPAGMEANCQFVYFSRAAEINAPVPSSRSVSLVAVYTPEDTRRASASGGAYLG